MPRACGFCGGPEVSKEHLWPEWILEIIRQTRGAEGKTFAVEHERHRETTRFRSVKLETKVGMPCKMCNNGWMSELENSVKPFMSAMVFPGDPTFLSEDRRRLLARWVVKTAMVYEFFRPDSRFYFTANERKTFMTSAQPPNGVWVWLGKYDATRPMHSSQDRRIHTATQEVHFYSLTITANFFAAQVVASRDEGPVKRVPVADMPPGALLKIWPLRGTHNELVQWPPALMMGPTGLGVLDNRFREGEARQWQPEEIEN